MNNEKEIDIAEELSECYAYAEAAHLETKDEIVDWLAGCVMQLTQIIANVKGVKIYEL